MQKTFTFNSKPKCCVKANDRLYPVADYEAKTNRIIKKTILTQIYRNFFLCSIRDNNTLKTTIKIEFISMRHETL